jgi:hypothetical protein
MPMMKVFTLFEPSERPFQRILIILSFLLQYCKVKINKKVRKMVSAKVIPLMVIKRNIKHRYAVILRAAEYINLRKGIDRA